MSTIHFITDYIDGNTQRSIDASVSCVTVSSYIKDAILASSKHSIAILSTASGVNRSYLTQEKQVVNNRERHIYLAVLKKRESKLVRVANQIFTFLQVIFYLISRVKSDDFVLIYHGSGISRLMRPIRKIVKRKYVYFVGEIYAAVGERSKKEIDKEVKNVSGAYGYIYGNNLMNCIFGFEKPYAICYSSYKTCHITNQTFGDDKVHIVYAGKIARKIVNDAFVAAECSRYLDERYKVHILGYGNPSDLKDLNNTIEEINKAKGYEAVSFDGCLSGKVYDDFLSKCNIGLCTRTLPEPYCNYCFPSKTLIYLSHNLVSICPNVKVLSESDISPAVKFVDDLSPEGIASCIRTINGRMDSSELVKELDEKFKNQLNDVLA